MMLHWWCQTCEVAWDAHDPRCWCCGGLGVSRANQLLSVCASRPPEMQTTALEQQALQAIADGVWPAELRPEPAERQPGTRRAA
jgi:hypothetical protein